MWHSHSLSLSYLFNNGSDIIINLIKFFGILAINEVVDVVKEPVGLDAEVPALKSEV